MSASFLKLSHAFKIFVDVAIVGFEDLLANLADFLDNRIVIDVDCGFSIHSVCFHESSSGVQMMGILKPVASITDCIL